eukprot:GHRR01015065.1.p1 GENE.GHRR01015065.1~~GHRR01015065.1.p1  ORF type:complete len:529 (+),score=170.50 GHRR01015065.1:192-1778(+)
MQRACFPSRGCQQHQSVFGARSRPRTRSCALRTVCSCNSSQHEKYAVSRRQLGLLVGSATLLSSGNFWAEAAEAPAALGFESRVCEFTLSNGLHFIVLERHNAPVVACHTHARVGAYVEEEGGTGLAHLLEHMAFKGTARIGSRDWSREQAMLQAQDEVFYELREMKQTAAASGSSSSISAKMQQLQDKFTQLKAESDELVVPNAFGSMLQQAGAVGLNAVTSHDDTRYYNLLPSNKLELWFALESERFQAPVFRQLYTEKEVIAEERRARWENSPIGRFTASYLLQALDNPYRCPVIGFADDFERFGSHEVREFFDRYYHPANLTITIVGDVDPAQAQQLAQQYFGTWAPAPQAVTLDSNLLQLAAERLPRSPAVTMGPVAAAAWQGSVTTAAADGSGSSYAMTLAHRSLSGNSSASSKGSSKGLWGLGAGAAQATPAGESDPFLQRTAAGPLLALGYYRPSLTGRKGTALEVRERLRGTLRNMCHTLVHLRHQCCRWLGLYCNIWRLVLCWLGVGRAYKTGTRFCK